MPRRQTTAQRLRRQFGTAAKSDAAVEALLTEACRIADRLDHIHAFETGKSEWVEVLRFRTGEDDTTIHVSINGVISEARQQANTLRALITTLTQAQPAKGTVPVGEPQTPLDELRQRRERRAIG